MAYARYESVAVNTAGDVIPNATIEVREDRAGRPVVPLWANREGTEPLGNPIKSDELGKFGFYAKGGSYYIRVFTGPSQQPFQQYVRRHQAIGTAAERDVEDLATALQTGTATFPTLSALETFAPSAVSVGGKVTTGPDAGFYHYDDLSSAWVFDRPLFDTLARMIVTGGTADAIEAEIETGVADSAVVMLWIEAPSNNTGPVTINGKPVLTIDEAPLLAGQWLSGRTYWFSDEGSFYKLRTESDVSGLVAQAEAAATSAQDAAGVAAGAAGAASGSAAEAAGYAAGLNLPGIGEGDAGKQLVVNEAGDGYILDDPSTSGGFGIDIRTLGVMGDNSTDDRDAIVQALIDITALGKTVVVPEGVYLCSDWIPLPDKLKMWFAPGAIWKLTANTPGQGHFLCGGYLLDNTKVPFSDVEIWNMALDCNNLAGENAMAAINGENVKIYFPKIYRTRHDPATLGGRAFQFEGAAVTGIDVYSPYIEDCSIGINSHGDPNAGIEVVRGVHYFDVVMKNVDIPFNVDGRFVGAQSGLVDNMSCYVHGVALENCGRPRWTGGPGVLGGAIIASDRGHGLSIDGLRLVNTIAYGKVGAFIRGAVFDLRVTNAQVDSYAGFDSLVNYNPLGYSGATTTVLASRLHLEVDVQGHLGVFATADDLGRVGRSFLDVTFGSDAGLAGFFDNFAASASVGVARVTYRDTGRCLGEFTFAALFEAGNLPASLLDDTKGFQRVHHRRSAPSGTNAALISVAFFPDSRMSINYVITVQSPAGSSNATLVARGTAAISVSSVGVVSAAIIEPQSGFAGAGGISAFTCDVNAVDLSDGTIALVINQTNDAAATCLVSVAADIDFTIGSVARQPRVIRM